MDHWAGRVALVTGGSGGIGRALVKKFVSCGMHVMTCARTLSKLQSLEAECEGMKGSLVTVQCDMQNEEQIGAMFKQLREKFARIDILVNNAGVGNNTATLLEGKTQDWREMLETNVLAVAICSREAFQLMKEKGIDDGHIVNIGSIAGHRLTGKHSAFYSITKHALTTMTEAQRREIKETNKHTRITLISPGMVVTDFHEKALGKDEKVRAKMKENLLKREGLKRADLKDAKWLTTDDIVDAVVYAVGAPPHVQIHDIIMRPTEQDF